MAEAHSVVCLCKSSLLLVNVRLHLLKTVLSAITEADVLSYVSLEILLVLLVNKEHTT